MADERIPQALDAGVSRRPWRTLIVFVLGLAAFYAATLLAGLLNELIWDAFWKKTRWPWPQKDFYRRPAADGVFTELAAVRDLLFTAAFALIPTLLFGAALAWKLRPGVFFFAAVLTPSVLTAIALSFFAYQPPYREYLQFLMSCVFICLIGTLAVTINHGGTDDEAIEPAHPEPAGIRKHPWRAWIILTVGLAALLHTIPFAAYIHEMIWHAIGVHYNTYAWDDHYAYLGAYYDSYYYAALKYALDGYLLFVFPFLLLVLAIRLRMRPWCGWILGLIIAAVQGGFYWAFENTMIYESASLALISGQCCGAILVVLLWFYHAKVSKLRYVPDDQYD